MHIYTPIYIAVPQTALDGCNDAVCIWRLETEYLSTMDSSWVFTGVYKSYVGHMHDYTHIDHANNYLRE